MKQTESHSNPAVTADLKADCVLDPLGMRWEMNSLGIRSAGSLQSERSTGKSGTG